MKMAAETQMSCSFIAVSQGSFEFNGGLLKDRPPWILPAKQETATRSSKDSLSFAAQTRFNVIPDAALRRVSPGA